LCWGGGLQRKSTADPPCQVPFAAALNICPGNPRFGWRCRSAASGRYFVPCVVLFELEPGIIGAVALNRRSASSSARATSCSIRAGKTGTKATTKGLSTNYSDPPVFSGFCSKLNAPHRGTSLGPFLCGFRAFSLCSYVEVAREVKCGRSRLCFESKSCIMACRRRWAIQGIAVRGKHLRWIVDTGVNIGSGALGCVTHGRLRAKGRCGNCRESKLL
jgi:hypothetical protein